MKKLLALILTIAMLAALPAIGTFAGTDDYTVGSVSYAGGSSNYYYTDSYFESPASIYNPSLATMSMCAALSGDSRKRVEVTLKEIGFKDLAFNDDYFNPYIDTLGTVIGHKTITADGAPYTLIIVDTNAGTAYAEWAGNFTLGQNGNHKGFNLAAEEMLRSLNEYVGEYADTFESNAIKIWTMGFSRSAAASNLFAAKLTDDVRSDMKVDAWDDELTLTQENIYAYTFETPVGGSTDNVSVKDAEKNYTNIHNIVNPADLVTMVAPSEWGFVRYGVDENVIPSSDSARYAKLYNEMLGYFISFNSNNVKNQTLYDDDGNPQHILSTFTGKKLSVSGVKDTDITVEDFLDEMFTEFTTALGARSNYASDIEEAARNIIAYVCINGIDTDALKAFADSFKNKLQNNYAELLTAAVSGKEALYEALSGYISDAAEETGFALFSVSELKGYIDSLMPYALNILSADILYSHGEVLLTALNNITTMITAHYPELCLAWLECRDSNYNPDAEITVPEYCVYTKTTAAKVGNYEMTVDGITKNITVTANAAGFNLFSTAEGKYIGISGTTAVLTDTPCCWYYDGGFYVSSRSTLFSKLFSKYGKTYLSFTSDGFTASYSKKNITITETLRATDHTAICARIDNQTHTVTCAKCKAVINGCTSHIYNGDTCACGQPSADAAKVESITVNKSKIFRLFRTDYKLTITANAKYSVSAIQYSLDGGNTWNDGNTFTVKKSVPNFTVKTTDAAGNIALWSYDATSDTVAMIR